MNDVVLILDEVQSGFEEVGSSCSGASKTTETTTNESSHEKNRLNTHLN
jgi:acetylornithine/succinyldiaminopimelate/putrescine aminotransferase